MIEHLQSPHQNCGTPSHYHWRILTHQTNLNNDQTFLGMDFTVRILIQFIGFVIAHYYMPWDFIIYDYIFSRKPLFIIILSLSFHHSAGVGPRGNHVDSAQEKPCQLCQVTPGTRDLHAEIPHEAAFRVALQLRACKHDIFLFIRFAINPQIIMD